MININDVNWNTPGLKQDRMNKGLLGQALAFVIDEEMVESLPLDMNFAEMLISATDFKESLNADESKNIFIVDIINNGSIIESLMCDEKLYAILLSSPKICRLPGEYKYGYIAAPGWQFINNEFILLGEYE